MAEIPDNADDELEGQHPPMAQPAGSATARAEPGPQPAAGLAEHGLRAGAGQPELASGATRAPDDATRSFDTAQGQLSYAELAERLAAPLQTIDLHIRRGEYSASVLDETLLLGFHSALSSALFPADAGRYRQKAVQVGAHEPPEAHRVPQRMRDYVANVGTRLLHLSGDADELLLEFLAYAEGELLSIHPFPDLNGRVSRIWMTEILRRLQLPPVDVVPAGAAFRARYLAALAAADRRDWKPLMTLWKERLSQPAELQDIALPGCTPTPLASYLKALAVLRLVAEAGDDGGGDAQATGFWRDDGFVLRTRLTREQLADFFLERYRPTPLIAPWNGGSGFYAKDNKVGIDALAVSNADRFDDYRKAIEVAKSVVNKLSLLESPKQDGKAHFLTAMRNAAPDRLLRWMDAAITLSDGGPSYPPLLGTGGNDGRLDFTNNFMQRVTELVDPRSGRPLQGAADGIRAALEGTATASLAHAPIGQFAPGGVGGPNAGSGFEGEARINPWDFVLMLEGAVLFAASTARRLESSDPAVLVAPFTVRSRSGTVGSAAAEDDANARGEVWMPLWSAACSLPELQSMLMEGRAAVDARPSRDGLDFARAVSQLGIDRGIDSFQRFGFLMRSGKAYLATPLNRMVVRRNPDADLISELDRHRWLASIQRHARDDNAPNAVRSAARQLDTALFALTQQAGRPTVQAVLSAIGRIDAALHRSEKSHEAVRAPAPRLSRTWARTCDDGTAEFRIACALAGLGWRDSSGKRVMETRRHMFAVSEAAGAHGDRVWEPTSRIATWGVGSLPHNLGAMLHRRRLEAVRQGCEGELLASCTGATRQDIATFLAADTDDARIAALLAGLACVDLQGIDGPRTSSGAPLPPAFAILKILFTPESVLRALQWLPPDRSLRAPAELSSRLASNDVRSAVSLAWQRLRALGVKLPGRDPPRAVAADGPRWLAALCIPLSAGETARMLRQLKLDPEAKTAADSSLQPENRGATAA